MKHEPPMRPPLPGGSGLPSGGRGDTPEFESGFGADLGNVLEEFEENLAVFECGAAAARRLHRLFAELQSLRSHQANVFDSLGGKESTASHVKVIIENALKEYEYNVNEDFRAFDDDGLTLNMHPSHVKSAEDYFKSSEFVNVIVPALTRLLSDLDRIDSLEREYFSSAETAYLKAMEVASTALNVLPGVVVEGQGVVDKVGEEMRDEYRQDKERLEKEFDARVNARAEELIREFLVKVKAKSKEFADWQKALESRETRLKSKGEGLSEREAELDRREKEVQAVNEELQDTKGELQDTKEDLQSAQKTIKELHDAAQEADTTDDDVGGEGSSEEPEDSAGGEDDSIKDELKGRSMEDQIIHFLRDGPLDDNDLFARLVEVDTDHQKGEMREVLGQLRKDGGVSKEKGLWTSTEGDA